jgi:hypothetical protein
LKRRRVKGGGEKERNRNWREGNGLESRTGIGTGEEEIDWREGQE